MTDGRYRTIVADPPWDHEDGTGVNLATGAITGPSYESMDVVEIRNLPVRDFVAPGAHLYLWTTSRYLPEAFGVLTAWGFAYSATLVWCKSSRGFGMGGAFQNNVEFVLFAKALGGHDYERVVAVSSALADAAERLGLSRADVDRHMGTSDMAGWWLSRLAHRCAVPNERHWPRLRNLLRLGADFDVEIAALNAAKAERNVTQKADTRWFQWPRGAHSAKPEAFLDLVEQVSPPPRLEMFARRARFGWDYWGDESLGTVEMPEVAA